MICEDDTAADDMPPTPLFLGKKSSNPRILRVSILGYTSEKVQSPGKILGVRIKKLPRDLALLSHWNPHPRILESSIF
jgi:hypothetical protein